MIRQVDRRGCKLSQDLKRLYDPSFGADTIFLVELLVAEPPSLFEVASSSADDAGPASSNYLEEALLQESFNVLENYTCLLLRQCSWKVPKTQIQTQMIDLAGVIDNQTASFSLSPPSPSLTLSLLLQTSSSLLSSTVRLLKITHI